MAALLFFISFILGLVFLVGLIAPKKILRKSENPTRGKVFLFFGLPSIALFIGFGALYESSWEEALKDPASAAVVSLKYKDLEILPVELEQMTNLESLDLAKNNLTSLPEYLKDFDQLESIDLSENPIENLPAWLAEMESLKNLILEGTRITSIPEDLNELSISYSNTPLWIKENPEGKEIEKIEESTDEDDHTESLGEYAMRQFLGKDYGHKRKFLKGEIFYNDPITKEQVDPIGELMVSIELFDNEQEASMLLDYEDEVYKLKIVVVSEEVLTDVVMEYFTTIKDAIQQDFFPEDEFHIVLTNGEFEAIKTIE